MRGKDQIKLQALTHRSAPLLTDAAQMQQSADLENHDGHGAYDLNVDNKLADDNIRSEWSNETLTFTTFTNTVVIRFNLKMNNELNS